MTNVKFFALGGLDENGKNCYVLDINNDLFVMNFGTKVPIVSTYGIDTLIPDYDYLKNNAKRIKGIFIVDTKNDSLSGLPWLVMEIPNIPIFCSSFSRISILERLSTIVLENDTDSNGVGAFSCNTLILKGSLLSFENIKKKEKRRKKVFWSIFMNLILF